jgi:hypothetical protein
MNLFGKYYSWFSVSIITAIILVVAYYLGNRTGKGKAAAADSEALQKELDNSQLTYEPSQYTSWADKLFVAMNGFTDDEEAIYSVIAKLRTKSDLLQLIKSFGSKRIQFTLGDSNLNQFFANRLESSEIAKINDILSRNSISYEF